MKYSIADNLQINPLILINTEKYVLFFDLIYLFIILGYFSSGSVRNLTIILYDER